MDRSLSHNVQIWITSSRSQPKPSARARTPLNITFMKWFFLKKRLTYLIFAFEAVCALPSPGVRLGWRLGARSERAERQKDVRRETEQARRA